MNGHSCETNGGWVKHPQSPVLGGGYGTCFDIALLKEENVIRMYFSWRDKESIAVCESCDGVHWSEPEICIAPRQTPEGWEDRLNRMSVVKRHGVYHMWYTGQTWEQSYIFHAVSEDGVHFTRTGGEPVLKPELEWENTSVMCPSVEWDEARGVYRMWYSAGEQHEPNAIGYAESEDGLRWRRSPVNPIFAADPDSQWERHKVTACHVFYHEDWYWMFYIGFFDESRAQIGMARSRNGITGWERSKLNPIIVPTAGGWDADACYKPYVLKVGDRWMLWYNGRTGCVEQIGLAVHEEEKLDF